MINLKNSVIPNILRRIHPGLALLALFVGLVQVRGQSSPFDRPRVYDVQHYTIRINFDREKKLVFGDTTVQLTPLSEPLGTVDLDAVDLRFTSVKLGPGGKDLIF